MRTLLTLAMMIAPWCNVFTQVSMKQKSTTKPTWINGVDAIQSNDFRYFIGEGYAETIDEARKSATQSVINQYAQTLGTTYIVGTESSADIVETQTNTGTNRIENFQFKAKIQGVEKPVKIPCLSVVEHYWEQDQRKGGYNFWVLIRIPYNETYCNKPFYKSYGTSAVFRSAILPGWGQLYKGQTVKGYTLMATTLGAAAFSVFSQTQYQANYQYSRQTQNYQMIIKYRDKGDNWATMRNVSGIAAGALYLYGLIDAAASKGEKRYADGARKIDILPCFDNNGWGLYVAIPIKH